MDLDLAVPADAPRTPLELPLLALLNEARIEHGLRVHDHARYRAYCSAKVHRLRAGLRLTHADAQHAPAPATGKHAAAAKSKAAKARRGKKRQTPASQSSADKGHANVFTRKTIRAADVRDNRALQLLLFEAERAWAFAQDKRTSDTPSPRQASSHARRSLYWATQLQALAGALAPRLDARARGQIAAYAVALRGGVAFDKEDHPAALRKLSVARLLFTALADAAAESKQAALANSWVDQSDAQLRFSAYQLELGDGSPDEIVSAAAPPEVCEAEVPGFAALLQELESLRGERKVRSSVTITWREEVIPVRNAELVDALARVHAAEQALGKAVDAHDEDAQRKTAEAPAKGHKRQRLTSAQRTAKKRASAGGAAPGADGVAAVGISATGGRTQLDPYDRALGALSDAEELARRLVEDNAAALAKSHSTRYEAAGKDLQRAHEYLQYRLLSLRVRRNAHLVEEVNLKAARREKRAQDALERRLASGSQSQPRKRKEGVEPKRPRPAKPARKNGPGARAKRPRATPRATKRKPARSGARKARAQRAASKEERARSVEAEKQRRRAARAVPGVAKLLDGAEASLSVMASLGLVEAQPDVSSLIDAKAAWYKAEVLRILARAYDLGGAQDHALLLLARAQLFVRQARQAAELVDDAGDEDADAPPRMVEATFVQTKQLVDAAQKDAQRELYFAQHGMGREASSSANLINSAASRARTATSSRSGGVQRGTAQRDTKAGQAVRDLATKHVTFDADDLAHAAHLSDSREAELQQELRAAVAEKQQQQSSKAAAAAKKSAPAVSKAPASSTPAKQAPVAATPPAPAAKEPAAKAAPPAAKSIPEAVVETVKPPLAAAAEAVQPPLQAAAQTASAAVEQVAGGGEPYDPGNVTDEEEEQQRAAQTPKKGWLGGWFGGR